MKIKIFRGIASQIEQNVNNFLKENIKIIEIKYSTPFTIAGDSRDGYTFDLLDSIVILYNEVKEELKDGEEL